MPQYVKYFFNGGVILIVSSSAYNKLQLQQFLHINFHSADVDKLLLLLLWLLPARAAVAVVSRIVSAAAGYC